MAHQVRRATIAYITQTIYLSYIYKLADSLPNPVTTSVSSSERSFKKSSPVATSHVTTSQLDG